MSIEIILPVQIDIFVYLKTYSIFVIKFGSCF